MKHFTILIMIALPHFLLGAGGLFQKMKPGTHAYVADGRQDGLDARLSLQALQGLINQEVAEVYVLNDQHHREQLDLAGRAIEALPTTSGKHPGLRALFGRFKQRVQKLNVYDPEKDWTFYLSLMDGAQNHGIPVTKEVKDMLVAQFDWNGAIVDFRNRWKDRLEAYDWAIENLLPRAEKKVLLVGSYHMRMFDYAVASRSFVFWLDFTKDREIAQIEKIIKAGGYGVGVSLMGYANNGDAANILVNKFGVGYVTSDFYANGSFWASFPSKTYTQREGKAVATENGKVYVSLIWSDGDNLQFDQNMLYKAWKDPARGSIPVGTALSPALQELNTPLMDYFYDNRTPNDELIAGPCGFQFIYTVHFKKELYPRWLELNREWVRDAGFHTGSLWWTRYPSPAYDLYTKTTALDGIFHNFNDIGNEVIVENGVGIFREYITECRDAESVYRDLANVPANPMAPEFRAQKVIQPYFLPNGYAMLKGVADRLRQDFPGKYVFLLPSDFVASAKQYYDSPAGKAARSSGAKGIKKQTALGQAIERADFPTRNTPEERRFLHQDNRSNIDKDHRFADQQASWTYRFDLPDDTHRASLTLDIAGHYQVSVSADDQAWTTVLRSNKVSPREKKRIELTKVFRNNPHKVLLVRFADGSEEDGHGPSLWRLSLDSENQ